MNLYWDHMYYKFIGVVLLCDFVSIPSCIYTIVMKCLPCHTFFFHLLLWSFLLLLTGTKGR